MKTDTRGAAAPPGRAASPARPGFSLTDLSLIAMAVIWGVNYSVVKFGAQAFAPLAYNASRVSLATVVLFGLALVARRAWPSPKDALRLFALGLIGNGLYQILFVEALSRTRVGNVALVLASTPVWLAIVGRVRGTDRISRGAATGIGLSIAGIVLVVLGGAASGTSDASLVGDALALAGCWCWVLYSTLLRPFTHRTDPVQLSAITMLGGVPPLLVAGAGQIASTPWAGASVAAWGALLYGALLAIVVAYLFWYNGLKVLGPTRTAMYANLQPVIALVVAALTLGEMPTIWQIVGASAIMGGLLLTRS